MLSLYQDLCSKAPSLKSPCSSLPGQQSHVAPLPLCLRAFWILGTMFLFAFCLHPVGFGSRGTQTSLPRFTGKLPDFPASLPMKQRLHSCVRVITGTDCLRILKVLASLVAQMVKNLPAMRETWVQSPGWEDPLEEGMATHSSILTWRVSKDRGAWWAAVYGVSKSQTRLSNSSQHSTRRLGIGEGPCEMESTVLSLLP